MFPIDHIFIGGSIKRTTVYAVIPVISFYCKKLRYDKELVVEGALKQVEFRDLSFEL